MVFCAAGEFCGGLNLAKRMTAPFRVKQCFNDVILHICREDIYIYLEPVCPLFWGLNPQKQGLFQSKQGSVGFQV